MTQADDNLQHVRVVVAGGSIGGLCAGLALRCAGCNVEIFGKEKGDRLLFKKAIEAWRWEK